MDTLVEGDIKRVHKRYILATSHRLPAETSNLDLNSRHSHLQVSETNQRRLTGDKGETGSTHQVQSYSTEKWSIYHTKHG